MLHRVTDPDDPRLAPFRDLKEAELAARDGLFIVEGRFILRILLETKRWEPRCVLVSPAAIESLRDIIDPDAGLPLHPGVPVLLADQPLIERTAGFSLHRGCVAAVARPEATSPAALLESIPPGPATIAMLEEVNNHDNIGGIFRNAAAFGLSAIVLTPDCADPLYRKAIRVSMGGVLRVPYSFVTPPPRASATETAIAEIRRAGFTTIALTPATDARNISDFDAGNTPPRVALMLGAEGSGLSPRAMSDADMRVRIPIVSSFDSLNVATAAGIAMHRFAAHG